MLETGITIYIDQTDDWATKFAAELRTDENVDVTDDHSVPHDARLFSTQCLDLGDHAFQLPANPRDAAMVAIGIVIGYNA